MQENHERLRERAIGIELFQRPANYDANNDPIVRVTASDARRRLSQYYRESGSDDALRLDLPPGSYCPVWNAVDTGQPPEPAPPPAPSRRWRLWAAGALVIAAVAIAGIWWRKSHPPQNEVAAFWAPLLASNGPVLISMGTPNLVGLDPFKVKEYLRYWDAIHEDPLRPDTTTPRPAIGFDSLKPLLNRYVPFGDAVALSRFSVFLDRHGKVFRVRPSGMTSQADFSEGTVVLVGAYTNEWLLRATESMRYRFVENRGAVEAILDSSNGKLWRSEPVERGDVQDYALICRAKDRSSDRYVLSVAGLRHPGTNAASDCVLSDACLAEAAAMAGPKWSSPNLEIFLEARTAHTDPGKPHVLAVHAW